MFGQYSLGITGLYLRLHREKLAPRPWVWYRICSGKERGSGSPWASACPVRGTSWSTTAGTANHVDGQVDPLRVGGVIKQILAPHRELAGVRVYRGMPTSDRDPKGYGAASAR